MRITRVKSALLVSAIFLAGCSISANKHKPLEIGYLPSNKMVGGKAAQYDRRCSELAAQLVMHGMTFLHSGEQVSVLIPNKRFFIGNSANWVSGARQDVLTLSRFLRCYQAEEVMVSSYVSPSKDAQYDTALTKKQSQAVMNALWNAGIRAQVMYAQGGGSTDKMGVGANNQSLNPHVKIHFRYLVDKFGQLRVDEKLK